MQTTCSLKRAWCIIHCSYSVFFRFCEDPPDERHAWTLAVARDGTQHLQLKEIVDQDNKASAAIMQAPIVENNPFKSSLNNLEEIQFKNKHVSLSALLNDIIQNGNDSVAAASTSSSVKYGAKEKSTEEKPLWKAILERKRNRSNSETQAVKDLKQHGMINMEK